MTLYILPLLQYRNIFFFSASLLVCEGNEILRTRRMPSCASETRRNEEIIQNTSNNRRSGMARSFVPRFSVSFPLFFACSFSTSLDEVARTRHVEINAAIARNKRLTNHTCPRSLAIFNDCEFCCSIFSPQG